MPSEQARTYSGAVEDLERILAEIEDDHIDVDVLAARVREAAELLRFCRQRIDAARVDIEQVMADLEPDPVGDALA